MSIGRAVFYVVDINPPTPFLLTIDGMDTAGIYLNNLRNEILHRDGWKWQIVRLHGHLFLTWGRVSMTFLTETKLWQLYYCFSHPSINRIIRTL